MNRRTGWALLITCNVLAYYVLGFYQTTVAGSPGGSLPFANSTETKLETVQELKEIKELLKEQNALLRSGDLKVIVTELPKAAAEARPAAAAETIQIVPAEPLPR